MFLIPFIYRKTVNIYPIHMFHIFLTKGTVFLEVDVSEIEGFCAENGLIYKSKHVDNNFCYLEVDTDKTKMEEFYTYFENSEVECWRRFILVGTFSEDFLHINDTNPELITPILNKILTLK